LEPAKPSQRKELGSPGTLGELLYSEKTKPPVPESDWVGLVQSIAQGDERALRSLYERTHRIVFTLIVRITRNPATAEELTLDVFHDVWRRASTYDPAGGSVVGWIMNQARSRAIDRVRFDQRKKRVNQDADNPLPVHAASGPQETFDLKDQARRVRDALTVLKPEERQVIETAFFSELTYGQVAERLQQPVGTVKTRIRSALGKLRQVLAKTAKES
jgi:RNA polymerase sigma-70 factor, ECF subfamily